MDSSCTFGKVGLDIIMHIQNMAFQELRHIARDHRPKIKGFSHMNKEELLQRLLEVKVLSQEDVDKYNHVDYERLRYIKNQPRPVEIFDKETGETTVYRSIYSAGKAYGVNAKTISGYDGKTWKQRYEIQCLKD